MVTAGKTPSADPLSEGVGIVDVAKAVALPSAPNPNLALSKFLVLDPGSRTKRYLAGFGAGKSSVKVSGSVKDAGGQVIATFEQRRIGAMGLGGGDSLGKLMSEVHENIYMGPLDGVRAAGGSWAEIMRYGVVPQGGVVAGTP